MTSDEDDISWWRADARDLARWAVRTARSIPRADLIFTGYGLALCAVALFVWPAAPVMALIWLPQAVRLFIWPDRTARAVERRMAEGDDRYFEEQRFYRAYPGLRNTKRLRVRSAIVIFGSLVLCLLEIWR